MASFILRQVDNAIAKAKDAAKEAERARHQADIDELAAMGMLRPVGAPAAPPAASSQF